MDESCGKWEAIIWIPFYDQLAASINNWKLLPAPSIRFFSLSECQRVSEREREKVSVACPCLSARICYRKDEDGRKESSKSFAKDWLETIHQEKRKKKSREMIPRPKMNQPSRAFRFLSLWEKFVDVVVVIEDPYCLPPHTRSHIRGDIKSAACWASMPLQRQT